MHFEDEDLEYDEVTILEEVAEDIADELIEEALVNEWLIIERILENLS